MDAGNDELLEIYEYVNTITKKRTGVGTITLKEFLTLVKHPTSALNFLSGRKVPLNDLERFRTEFVKSNFEAPTKIVLLSHLRPRNRL